MKKSKIILSVLVLFNINAYGDNFKVYDNPVKYSYVAIQSSKSQNILPAKLTIPSNVTTPPVVIIAHGSGGVDERGKLYAENLNKSGFATLEIDMWSARNLKGGLSRPQHVNETIPDILASIEYLKTNEKVNSQKIGLIGFSWGGVLSMLLSDTSYNAPPELKAMVANYPVCWAYNKVPGYNFKNLRNNINTLIISGNKDLYDKPNDCSKLTHTLNKVDSSKVNLIQLNNATHGFDNRQESSTFYDPYAFQGKGGNVPIVFNPQATKIAVDNIVKFFKTNL
ncbi:hypothetical protein B9T31_05410 [Acinetobacter sp. ANC 4558]|uniref:dienelactone hydrolase family protein n=1 Tax=Acinetobacter sp. ANC 4558 TaxID=1977876 RepID=UPI000A353F83|nr:dienelactone hydrolase family protein [Acinetobacter sp. ANC 4558]OTG87046.1 hypothetical protein B9T31_05410 [Acinetobacter sp. ANC 4558]